jgi:hypothetical protein
MKFLQYLAVGFNRKDLLAILCFLLNFVYQITIQGNIMYNCRYVKLQLAGTHLFYCSKTYETAGILIYENVKKFLLFFKKRVI